MLSVTSQPFDGSPSQSAVFVAQVVTLQLPLRHPSPSAFCADAGHALPQWPQLDESCSALLSQYGCTLSQCCQGFGQVPPLGVQRPLFEQPYNVGMPREGPAAAFAQLWHPVVVHP
jgi:hypothetical protein